LRLAGARRQGGLPRQIGPRRLSRTWRQSGLVGRTGLLLSGARRQTRSRRQSRLLLTLTIRRARLLLLTGTVLLTGLLLALAARHGRQRGLTGLPG
jgi:hypothetical protein